MPDGALKLQLLGEIADLVQLTGRELSALWNPAAPGGRPAREGGWKKDPGFGQNSYAKSGLGAGGSYGQARSRPGGRAQPASRADHATRILLGQSALWDTLSNEDHSLLCHLPEPHGPLLAWLEGQMHEHGALPWEALRESLRGQAGEPAEPGEELALRLMSDPTIPVQPMEDSAPELRDLLNRMLIEQLKALETEAIDASKSDPQALQRYKALRERRVQLMASLEKTQTEGIILG
jgi:DNA primase